MVFHKTDEFQNPGVGDYSIAETLLKMRNRSPNATIGQSPRFYKEKLNEYRANLPSSYVADAQKLQAKPPKMGTIYKQKRWNEKMD